MSSENSSFNSYPIEFKEINPEDFTQTIEPDGEIKERNVFTIENNNEKIIIEPNENGYISEVLDSHIDIHHKNTVVINAAVGQGKTTAIIQTVREYLEDDTEQEYLIMVASPYVSLVKQYTKDINLKANIPLSQIYSYDNIGRSNISYTDKKVHIITVNTLLGNPGENEFRNSQAKRDYLNNLSNHCKNNNIKVVFIYDEIHASYYNFEEKYIFNLWKWKDVIHKNFIISATYNEASKVIIEYLAELTSRRIKIIESKRTRIPHKQSSLHLHFTPALSIKSDNPQLVNLIDSKLEERKNIDILCFSKKLSQDILNSEIGDKLSQRFGEIKLCVSELDNNQRPESNTPPRNQFENSRCNIGTNFSTGVSIEKENHAFVIIFPSRSTRGSFKNEYGIFTDGINSIVQAIARQRLKGEIHILLYNPDKFDYSSLANTNMTNEQKEEFEVKYSNVEYFKTPKQHVIYKDINSQNYFLKNFYNNLKSDLEEEISFIESSNRTDLPSLSYPSFSRFQLEESSKFLASKVPIFGKDISACLTYLALTNQLVNCKLKSITIKPKIYFTLGSIQNSLFHFYKTYINPHEHEYYLATKNNGNFSLFYNDIRDNLFNNFKPNIRVNENSEWDNLHPYSKREFEIELIKFCYNIYHYRRYYENTSLTRGNYFLNSIKIASSIDFNLIPNTEENKEFINRVKLYQLLNYFRLQITDKIETYNVRDNEIKFLPNSPNDELMSSENLSKIEELESLLSSDVLLNNNIFKFNRNIIEKSNNQQKINSLYSMIIEDFFESENYRLTTNNRPNGKKIISIKELPSNHIIDLISLPLWDEIISEEEILEHYGSVESYEKEKNEIMEILKDML